MKLSFDVAKQTTGRAEYDIRYWHSWQRHITLSLMAPTYLAETRRLAGKREAEKKSAAHSRPSWRN